mgnify:CR=1 FL=1
MDFHILLEEASNHLRYQKQLLDHMIFPEPCAKYAFNKKQDNLKIDKIM